MKLVTPDLEHLPDYAEALRRGWLPDTARPGATSADQLGRIARDPAGFVAGLDDPDARGGPVILPDGSTAERLPGFHRWIWQGGFCGTISLRWRPGTEALPPTCLGHVGYGVVPWRRREGLASAALLAILPEARRVGLRYVEVTTDAANLASAGVIEKAGGAFVERFTAPPACGGHETLRYRLGAAA
jgi:predicted acetyltransferase